MVQYWQCTLRTVQYRYYMLYYVHSGGPFRGSPLYIAIGFTGIAEVPVEAYHAEVVGGERALPRRRGRRNEAND